MVRMEDDMFEDSLLESGGRFRKQRNPWVTVASFALEAAVVGLLVLVPLIYTEALPVGAMASVFTTITAPMSPSPNLGDPGPRPPAREPAPSNFRDGQLVFSGRIPSTIANLHEDLTQPPGGFADSSNVCVGCIPGLATGPQNPVLTAMFKPPPVIATVKPQARPTPVSSVLIEGLLIRRITPLYPELAKRARVQGSVVLAATISREGTIENLTTLSGHPLLVASALAAVRQWRYRPYILNKEPVEVETTVTVNFTLN
jgi:protein TonB